jgi:integrase
MTSGNAGHRHVRGRFDGPHNGWRTPNCATRPVPLAGGGRGAPQPDGTHQATDRSRAARPDRPDLRRLLAACAGRSFEARRPTIIMLLLDTGARRAELADLRLAHVDLDLDVLLVLGNLATAA